MFDTRTGPWPRRCVTKATQAWRFTRVVDFSGHDWRAFLPPSELALRAAEQGMSVEEVVGLGRGRRSGPRGRLRPVAPGKLSYRQVSERLDMGGPVHRLSYMGYAVRALNRLADPT